MSFAPHHELSYHMPNVAHGRYNLNPGPMLAGVVNVADTRAAGAPNIAGLVMDAKAGVKGCEPNVHRTSGVPATKLPLGMVRLEMR